MESLTKTQLKHYQFALLFRQFMLINNRHSFSSIEIKDIGIQLNKILNRRVSYSSQYIVKILENFGIKNVLNSRSHSFRSRLWFHKSLDPNTLKVNINV